MDPIPLDGAETEEHLRSAAGQTITAAGLGSTRAMELFEHTLAPACCRRTTPATSPSSPARRRVRPRPSTSSSGASSIYGGSWMEGAGAVYAENQALRWISDLAGLPESAGGVFVPGGTVGNLSALVVARHTARARAKEAGTGARPLPDRRDRQRALLRRVHGRRHGRRGVRGPRRREAAPDRPELRKTLEEPAPRPSSPWSRRAARRTSASSTTSRRSPRCAASTACAARRRGLRRRRPRRTLRPAPLPRHRARRLVHRRPAQVALRAFDCCAPHLPRAGAGTGRAHAGGATSTSSRSRRSGTRPHTPSA